MKLNLLNTSLLDIGSQTPIEDKEVFYFMAIYKSKHASNYTVLPNEVFKSKLSIEAIGLLSYFLSLPPDWVIYKTTLHSQLNIGRDKLNKVFDELRNAGYVISLEKRDAGKISYEHIVYDTPYNGEPLTGKPSTEKPSTVKLPLLSTNIQSTNKQITIEQINKDKDNNILFEKFWDMYPVKVARKDCLKKFIGLSKKTQDLIFETLPSFIAYKPFETYTHPNPLTYLNKERWNDVIVSHKINNTQPNKHEGFQERILANLEKQYGH